MKAGSKKGCLKWLFAAAGCLSAFLLMEIAIRVINPAPRPLRRLNVGGYVLSENPVLKYEYKPGYRPTDPPFDPGHRNFAINSSGFRDHEFPLAKPAGTRRIVVLGDSLTAGNGIDDLDATYPKVLQKLLNSRVPESSWEVLNMGVGGYHTLQEVETLRVKGLSYDPDIVIIGFSITDFVPDQDGYVYDDLLYNLEEKELISLVRITRLSGRALHAVLGRSRLLYFVYHRWKILFSAPPEPIIYERDILKGRNPVEVGLSLLDRLQRTHGFRSYLFVIPGEFGKFEDYRHGAFHLEALALAGRTPALRAFDLLDAFRARNPDGRVFTTDGSHMNELGHRALAELMAEVLQEDLRRKQVSGPGR